MAVGPSGSSDDADGTGLIRVKTEGEGEQVGPEYSHLGGGADQQQPRLGDQGGEIRHGSDSEEYERWVPTLLDSLVQNIQYGAVLIDSDVKSREHRDVADDHSESDRNEQERLPFLLDGKCDEHDADQDHHQILPGGVGESGEVPELP